MSRFLSVLVALTIALPVLAGPADTDAFFQTLEAQVGSYHQSGVALALNPQAEPKNVLKVDRNSTLAIEKLSKDKYVVRTFAKGEGKATASVTTIERSEGKILVTSLDLNDFHKSYRVEGRIGSRGTELSYYQSEVTYLEKTPESDAKRKHSLKEKQLGLAALVLVLTLGGENVPAEVIENEDFISVLALAGEAGLINSEVYLDPRGKSERRPKGEPSLTLLQAFQK